MSARNRRAKIVATLGPASSTAERIRALFLAGADVFRLNASHGTQADHLQRLEAIRALERETGRPIATLLDLQGPKLRVGTFAQGHAPLEAGARFRFDRDARPGDARRVSLPHPEIFVAAGVGTRLLIDDGKVELRVESRSDECIDATVVVGGMVSDRKGVNVPGVVLPISALTEKDRADLAFGLAHGVDWIALSFVQRPADIDEARALVGNRAWIAAKLEKPAAIEHLDAIVERADGVMVARGDLGVELPAEQVPGFQKRIVRASRKAGKPVIVATQMLESMVGAPLPTRAEASDVATAVYDGADAVMLSAESASGKYPVEAVRMMDRIVAQVEADPHYREGIDASHTPPQSNVSDAIFCATRRVAGVLRVAATITYTSSGYSSLRAARERPDSPILGLTPDMCIARRLALVWGVHAVHADEVTDVATMVEQASHTAMREGFAAPGDMVVIAAGMPFGVSGSTNLLRIAQV